MFPYLLGQHQSRQEDGEISWSVHPLPGWSGKGATTNQWEDSQSDYVGHTVILGHPHWFKLVEWVVLGRLTARKLINREQSKAGASTALQLTRQVTTDWTTCRQYTQFCSKIWVSWLEYCEVRLYIWL